MKIGILVLMAGRSAGGPETYEIELLRALAAIDQKNQYIIYCTGPEAATAIGIEQPNFRYHLLQPPIRPLSISISLPWQLKIDGVNLLHSTFTPPPLTACPEILTVHCLSSFVHPEFYSPIIAMRLNALLRLGMVKSKALLCVSQSTANDIHQRFGIPLERMAVTYNGVSNRFRPEPVEIARIMVKDQLGIKGPYALFLGKIEPRKNITRLIEAFIRFRNDTGSSTRLVIAGGSSSVTPEIERQIAASGQQEAFLQLGYVSTELLSSLYSAARMFLFPSLWEGFGIPIIEAMACGTPVLTANTTCLPEIAASAALIVDPFSVEQIADGIAQLDASEILRQELSAKGLARAKFFTWEQTAKNTLAVYESINKG